MATRKRKASAKETTPAPLAKKVDVSTKASVLNALQLATSDSSSSSSSSSSTKQIKKTQPKKAAEKKKAQPKNNSIIVKNIKDNLSVLKSLKEAVKTKQDPQPSNTEAEVKVDTKWIQKLAAKPKSKAKRKEIPKSLGPSGIVPVPAEGGPITTASDDDTTPTTTTISLLSSETAESSESIGSSLDVTKPESIDSGLGVTKPLPSVDSIAPIEKTVATEISKNENKMKSLPDQKDGSIHTLCSTTNKIYFAVLECRLQKCSDPSSVQEMKITFNKLQQKTLQFWLSKVNDGKEKFQKSQIGFCYFQKQHSTLHLQGIGFANESRNDKDDLIVWANQHVNVFADIPKPKKEPDGPDPSSGIGLDTIFDTSSELWNVAHGDIISSRAMAHIFENVDKREDQKIFEYIWDVIGRRGPFSSAVWSQIGNKALQYSKKDSVQSEYFHPSQLCLGMSLEDSKSKPNVDKFKSARKNYLQTFKNHNPLALTLQDVTKEPSSLSTNPKGMINRFISRYGSSGTGSSSSSSSSVDSSSRRFYSRPRSPPRHPRPYSFTRPRSPPRNASYSGSNPGWNPGYNSSYPARSYGYNSSYASRPYAPNPSASSSSSSYHRYSLTRPRSPPRSYSSTRTYSATRSRSPPGGYSSTRTDGYSSTRTDGYSSTRTDGYSSIPRIYPSIRPETSPGSFVLQNSLPTAISPAAVASSSSSSSSSSSISPASYLSPTPISLSLSSSSSSSSSSFSTLPLSSTSAIPFSASGNTSSYMMNHVKQQLSQMNSHHDSEPYTSLPNRTSQHDQLDHFDSSKSNHFDSTKNHFDSAKLIKPTPTVTVVTASVDDIPESEEGLNMQEDEFQATPVTSSTLSLMISGDTV